MARKSSRIWIGGAAVAVAVGAWWWWFRRRPVVQQIGPRNVWRVVAIDLADDGTARVTTDRTFTPEHERDTQPSRDALLLAQQLVPTSLVVAVIEQGKLRGVWGDGFLQPSERWPEIASELAKLDVHAEAPRMVA